MWISNRTLKDLLNDDLNGWQKSLLLDDLRRAEAREEEKRQEKIAKRNAFYAEVVSLMQDYPGKPLCPTDLQFMYYNRMNKQISCSKIAAALHRLYLTTMWPDDDETSVPKDLLHVRRQRPEGHQRDSHAYYVWTE